MARKYWSLVLCGFSKSKTRFKILVFLARSWGLMGSTRVGSFPINPSTIWSLVRASFLNFSRNRKILPWDGVMSSPFIALCQPSILLLVLSKPSNTLKVKSTMFEDHFINLIVVDERSEETTLYSGTIHPALTIS